MDDHDARCSEVHKVGKKDGQYESRTRDLGVTELPGGTLRISTTL